MCSCLADNFMQLITRQTHARCMVLVHDGFQSSIASIVLEACAMQVHVTVLLYPEPSPKPNPIPGLHRTGWVGNFGSQAGMRGVEDS